MAKPRSLHPPPPPPPGGGSRGAPATGRRASPAKCQLPGRREAAAARAAPARPGRSTFIGAGNECGSGAGVPASPARAPGPPRSAPRRCPPPAPAPAPRLPAGDLVSPPVLPAFRLARRRPGAGRPDSARGAARKWPPGQAPRRRPGRPPALDPQWPQPGPGPALGRACRSGARAPCPRAQPGPPGSAPPHLPPQVRALPLSPVPAVPSTPRVSSGGDVAAFLVAARPPTRLLAHGASGLGVIPLVAKRKKRGTRNWGPGGGDCQKHWLLFPPRAAALLPPAPNHLWRVSGPHSALAPPGASLLPGGWRSQPSPPLGMEVWKIPALRLRATPLTPPCTS